MRNDPPPPDAPLRAAIEALLARGGDLLIATDELGRIRWRNAAFDAATGLHGEQVLGHTLFDLITSDTLAGPREQLRQAIEQRAALDALELALPAADGAGPLWVRLHTAAFDDPGGGGFVGVLHDHRVQHRERLEAQRLAELLDMAQEFGRLGVWEREIPAGVGHWDRHVFRMFDMDPSEGTPSFDVASRRIHPDDQLRGYYLESTRKPGRYARRYRVIGRDGMVRVIHSQWEVQADREGVPRRAVGIMVDDTEVYEMARSLSEINAQLDLALDLGNIAVWRHDLASGIMEYDHRAWRILGQPPTPQGWPIEKVRELIHPDDLPAVIESAEEALHSDKPVDFEARYRHTDGSWRYVLTRRVVQRDAKGQPIAFVGVGLDITDRVTDSRRALELGRRLDAVTRAARLGVWSLAADGNASEWNAQMFELYGLPPAAKPPAFSELLQRCVHPDDRARLQREGSAWIHGGEHGFEIEYRVVLPDGSTRWLLNRSDVERRAGKRRLVGVTMDVSERKRTEVALQEVSARIAMAARGAGIGTWMLDVASGDAYWDEQMFALRGLPPRDRAPPHDERILLIHPEDRQRVIDAMNEASRGEEPQQYEFRVRRADGSWRWIASRSQPVRDASGRVTRVTGANWDVTDARTAELERQERLAAQRESLAKTQFLARMSHELRTPLNAVLGFTQLLLSDDERIDVGSRRNRLQHIRSAGEHLLSLINDVLDLSSLQSGEMRMALKAVAVAPVVHETLALVEAEARARGIGFELGPLDVVVRADATRLRQVLLNLLSNAIKYNRDGGRVSIEADENGGYVRLAVRDTGRGLDEEQMKHLFEPFNRLGAEREGIEGTGVGLAVVKALVERMGGEIHAHSEPGAGSSFTVRLDDARNAVPTTAPGELFELPEDAKPYRGELLYIEDNPVNVLIVEELIARCPGLTLASEPDGTQGVARAKSMRPKLVLVDMQLPDFDGYEVLRRLRAEPVTAGIPCVALSANAMPEDIQRALAAGFVDYWTKPIDFRAFMASIDNLFAQR